MSLSEFHALPSSPSETTQTSSQSANIVRMNWADEMEKLDDSGKEIF